jgi:hypothetical protein
VSRVTVKGGKGRVKAQGEWSKAEGVLGRGQKQGAWRNGSGYEQAFLLSSYHHRSALEGALPHRIAPATPPDTLLPTYSSSDSSYYSEYIGPVPICARHWQ